MVKYIKASLDDIPDENKGGNCFKVAVDTLLEHPDYTLVHAVVSGQGAIEGIQYTHAFCVDKKSNTVIDNTQSGSNRKLPADLYYLLGNIEISREYTYKEALDNLLKYKHYGPWDSVFNNYY